MKNLKNTLIATTITLLAATAQVSASPFTSIHENPELIALLEKEREAA